MKKIIYSAIVCLLTGCAYHPTPISVYNKSGKQFTAPSLCAALVQCINSGEACYYDSTKVITAVGGVEESPICKEVK